MRSKLPLSSLSVGRCFVHDLEGSDAFDEASSSGAAIARTVMSPTSVWRVDEPGTKKTRCENALGQAESFDSKLMVRELPRGGFDRLVERVADPDDPLGS